MVMRIRRSITAAIVLALATSTVAMTWRDRPAPSVRNTHPSGSRSRKVVRGFLGRPFGLHVTTKGAILVTEQDVNVMRQLEPRSAGSSFEVGEDPGDVVATRDGEIAYVSGFQDGSITVVRLAGDTISDFFRLPTKSAYRLALSPNERKLYVSSTDGRLYVFNTA